MSSIGVMEEGYRQRDLLGARLKLARKKAKLTQRKLADEMDVNKNKKPVSSVSISFWESGSSKIPEARLKEWAKITKVSYEWLVNGKEVFSGADKRNDIVHGNEEVASEASNRNNTVQGGEEVVSGADNRNAIAHGVEVTSEASNRNNVITPKSVDNSIIAYQGRPGAYSHLACNERFPQFEPKPYESFKDCFEAVERGEAGLAMIPIENSLGGRVADIHLILPDYNLYIVDEHFQPVQHILWGQHDAELSDIKEIMSHEQALSQCRATIHSLGAKPVVFADTAGACEYIASKNDNSLAALASSLAGDIYNLKVLRKNVEDKLGNKTRFIVMSRRRIEPDVSDKNCITSFIFTLRSIPTALYKCMGGFATNSVNFIKLESYISMGEYETASFYAEIEGHIADKAVERAFSELQYFTSKVKIIGTFPKNAKR